MRTRHLAITAIVALLACGAVSGAPEYLLSRVAGAVRLPNGEIVIGDGGSNQLRFYDATSCPTAPSSRIPGRTA